MVDEESGTSPYIAAPPLERAPTLPPSLREVAPSLRGDGGSFCLYFPICNATTTPTTTSWSPSLDEGGKRMTSLWRVRSRIVWLLALTPLPKARPLGELPRSG